MSSFPQPRNIINAVADVDLSNSIYKAVRLTATGTIAVALAGQKSIGFLMNKPLAGQVCEIASFGGGGKGISAATLIAGTSVKPDGTGNLVAALSNELACAITLESSVAGDIIAVLPILHVVPNS